jgi:hypothetical protein
MQKSSKDIHSHSSAISNFCLEELSNHCNECNTPFPGGFLQFISHIIFNDQTFIRVALLKKKGFPEVGFKLKNLEGKNNIHCIGEDIYSLIGLILQMIKQKLGDI